jgi:dinuclear metal center YbgI/SA1388 family protein
MDATSLGAMLDRELRVAAFVDDSHNGLQVGSRGPVTRIACGVDASMAFFEEAAARGANFLICHHGLSWRDSLRRLTGLNYQRVEFLMRRGMALYACHLPLDAHPRLGNNAQLAKLLGLTGVRPFGVYHGQTIGCMGSLPAMGYAEFLKRVRERVGPNVRSMDFGPARVRRVAVVSGGAAEMVEEAAAAGADVFLSGEPKLLAYSLAQELGIHAVFAGHYDTEIVGVRAVGALLKRRLRVPVDVVRHDVPF